MENKTGKYFKYAIGEIILVVIGILIALQINNWNQNRLKKKQVNTYLQSMVTDLKSDIIVYERNLKAFDNHIENISRILNSNDYKQLKVDSINTLVNRTWSINTLQNRTYEKIKSTGLEDILGTTEIDNAVNDYYNNSVVHFNYYVNWNREMTNRDDILWGFSNNFEIGTPKILNLSSISIKQDSTKRKDELVKLIESTIGRNYLKNAIFRDDYGSIIIKDFKFKAENLIELIEKHIKK